MSRYQKKPPEVEAIRLKEKMVIMTSSGLTEVYPGDWVITEPGGWQDRMTDEDFQKNYALID